MGGGRPSFDRVAMERSRARTELALFGYAEPARIGRYQILEPIAGGGMGFVYAAYDPELDRRVALKVLHPERSHDQYAHERLSKDARALARLDHPNVVTVHDVLTSDDEVVIVMEFVAGETLTSWEAAAPRSWRDVVAAYLQAGTGLAAAHGLSIIHRDFKPSNAIIGPDGHVRVLDFGLARFTGEGPEPTRLGAPRRATMATASGAVLGTIGYAAPEQLSGKPVTAASDQFSFCVALHRAVEGVEPFGGTTVDELIARINADVPVLASDGRRIPPWLRAVVRRGLAAEPARRHASMHTLLSELGRPRGWKRWRWPAVAALLVVATVVATAELHDAAGALSDCDGGVQEATAVWGPRQRFALDDKIARVDTPYMPEVREHVFAELNNRTLEWSSVHRAACLDHRRGAVSDALLDRTMLCLHQRLGDVAIAISVLDGLGDADLVKAIDIVSGMPSAKICADSARMLAEVDLPVTPMLRGQVAAVRTHLSTGAALSRAGRTESAIAAFQAANLEAEGTQYRPVIAEAKLAYGRELAAQGEVERATPVLRDAMTTALAVKQTRLAVEAAARRIYAEGIQSADLGWLGRDLDFADGMSQSLVGDRFVRPLLLNNIGVVYMAAQRRDDALHYFQLAHEAMAGDGSPDLELTIVDRNIAMLTPDAVTRTRLSRETWLLLSSTLGRNHLDTLQALMAYAWFGADTATAFELITQACAAYHRIHPRLVNLYLACESAHGFLATELGHRDAAQAAYSAAIDAASGSSDPDVIVSRRLAAGELALLRGRQAEAREELAAVVNARIGSKYWWVREDALQAELDLGLAAATSGDRAAAIRHLDTAARGFADIAGINQGILYRLRLAKARGALESLTSDSPERGSPPHH
jgi:tetratricopeptide (TPR) repeat protein/predicted Ser/Thr protein kinase